MGALGAIAVEVRSPHRTALKIGKSDPVDFSWAQTLHRGYPEERTQAESTANRYWSGENPFRVRSQGTR